MRICYFGTYTNQEGYPMNEVLIRGLQENGAEVIECHENLWQERMEKVESAQKGLFPLLGLFFRYCRAYLSLAVRFFRLTSYDVLIVGYPGHLDFFLAKVLNTFRGRKPLLINLLFSLHDTLVNDRKLFPPRSFKARLIWEIDRQICRRADRVILDTGAHVDYFVSEFKIPKDRFLPLPVGADDRIFRPEPGIARDAPAAGKVHVLFFGTYIPLHGIDTILRAAHLLEEKPDIHFTLIGTGQTYPEAVSLARTLSLSRVTFIPYWMSYPELKKYIQNADICLGVFGTTEKAGRVIPCKVYNCLAMGRPIITADSPAAREFLENGVHGILVPPGDPRALAEAVARLGTDVEARKKMSQAGYELFQSKLSPKQTGLTLKQILEGMT